MSNNTKVPTRKLRNELTQEQKSEIKDAFDLVDSDGGITASELKQALICLGLENNKDIKLISDDIDRLGNKGINYDKFIDIMRINNNENDSNLQIKNAFNLFCDDGSNEINEKSLERMAKELGENITSEEIKEMIKEADKDGCGHVDEEDFIKFMKKTNLF